MAAAAYTTDLTLIHACDAASGSWTEPTGFIDGAITLPETDYFINGTGCLSKNMGTSTTAASGAIYNAGAGQTIPSGNAVMMWLFFGAPNALSTQANGGLRMFVGSATSAFKHWYVRGSNTYTYGGWVCVPVDPNTTQDATTGSPTATLQYFGAAAALSGASAVSKGNPFGLDVVRHGRAEARMNGGDLANGYATFAGFAAQNDAQANRWGLFQSIAGGYLWQGLMVLGYTSAVDFRDSNVAIQIANTEKVAAAFNKIEIRNASSRVDWTGVSIASLGTVSKGQLQVVDNADVNWDTCTFTDMDAFTLLSNTTALDTTWRRCGLVTLGGATLTGCSFDRPSGVTAVTGTPAQIGTTSQSSFVSDGTGHAITITGTAVNLTLAGTVFTGYAATNGSTGNEAIYVNIASGSMTISVTSGGNTPSIRTAGATVTVSSNVSVTLTGLKNPTEVRVFNAGTTTERSGTGAENITSGSHTFSLPAGTSVDISILSLNYQNRRILAYSTNLDATIPVDQTLDRQYLNP